jgi:hypothetical protein
MGQYVGKTPVANWTDRAGNEVRHDWQIGNRFTRIAERGLEIDDSVRQGGHP